MNRCSGIKADGSACERVVAGSQTYCWGHDPRYVEERKRTAAQGGRVKASDVRFLKDQLATLYRDIRDGHLDPRRGSVLVQVSNAQLRAVDLERSVREHDELEARMRILEGA